MITLEQAKNLRTGQVLYHITHRNSDGTPERWRVSGKPQTWKRNAGRVKVPVKHGLWNHGYLDEERLGLVCLTEEEADEG